jgi:transcriptional regulator with XRE-family HTH domain
LSDLEKLAAKRMRMLRLGEGWSAAQLSQQYTKSGAGELDRNTIAKIESNRRQIKAGEVEGVARVFGLTSADLLDPDGPIVFVSYAGQDRVAGEEVATWLGVHGFQVISAGSSAPDPASSGPAGPGIDTAQAFVALLSPAFLSSPRCREELEAAVRRKQQLGAAGLAADFIHVLKIAGTSGLDDTGLESYSPIDLPTTSDWAKEVALSKLGSRIISGVRTTSTRPGLPGHVQGDQWFLDRDEEVERVLYNLSSPAGSRFWLVTSPPGLGKSRFLEQLAAKVGESAAGGWFTTAVDLRQDAGSRQHDALGVVRKLFGIEPPQSAGPDDDPDAVLPSIAQMIIRKGQPWLCLLDSAELLPPSVIAQLRQYLSKIYRLIQDAGNPDARLALVVASGRDDGWKGLWPSPQPTILALDGFSSGAIQSALEGLASGMQAVHSLHELRRAATLVQQVSEGVPGLVEQILEWIEAEEWVAIERLNSTQFFEQVVRPYVRDRLLARALLLPAAGAQPESAATRSDTLLDALRALVPYRVFTLSHLSDYQDYDPSFPVTLEEANWSVDDLWNAITGMALFHSPHDEPWQEIHPALRRLLFRYFYRPDQQADAHQHARDFSVQWAVKLPGKERIVGLVESIWHEAARLRLSRNAGMGGAMTALTEYVRNLPFDVYQYPSSYAETELRHYAVQRMRNDDELQREVADVNLFEALVQVVQLPKATEA